MLDKNEFGYLSLLFTLISYAPYVRSICLGKTRPHILTWIIWTLVSGIAASAQYAGNAGPGKALYDKQDRSLIADLPYEERKEAFVKAITPLYTTINAVHPTKMYCSAGSRAFVTGLAQQHGLDMNWGLEGAIAGQHRSANIAALKDKNLVPMEELLRKFCREPGAPDITEGVNVAKVRLKRLEQQGQSLSPGR